MTELTQPVPKWKKLLVFPAIGLGIAIFVSLLLNKAAPPAKPDQQRLRTVRIIEATPVNLVPRVLAYGEVQPANSWQAIPEVSGQVIEVHPQLKKGARLNKGAELVRIDPSDYQLQVAQREADLKSVQAQLDELDAKESNTQASLAIEKRTLALMEKQLNNLRKLYKKGLTSQDNVDNQQQDNLAQQLRVQNLNNELNLLPTQRKVLQASLNVSISNLERAQLDLQRTVIRLPFDALISLVDIEESQYVQAGQVLATADSTERVEIAAQVAIDKVSPLIPRNLPPAQIKPDTLGISASVRLNSGQLSSQWPARLLRANQELDPQARTIGIIVAIDQPYRYVKPGVRPPLFKNMFVEVELSGMPLDKRLIVPRSAVHANQVYVLDSNNQLRLRPIETDFSQGNFVVVKTGLSAQEKVIVSDLNPAIVGEQLNPVLDQQLAEQLRQEATGAGAVK